MDNLRHTLRHFVREDTLKNASAEIVNRHHELPLSALHGDGTLSSSDAQRFKIRASSLLASYYPRYLGAAATLLISLAIFAFQLVFSAWWLDRYRFGPAEWVWRSLTYGEVQTLRRGD